MFRGYIVIGIYTEIPSPATMPLINIQYIKSVTKCIIIIVITIINGIAKDINSLLPSLISHKWHPHDNGHRFHKRKRGSSSIHPPPNPFHTDTDSARDLSWCSQPKIYHTNIILKDNSKHILQPNTKRSLHSKWFKY